MDLTKLRYEPVKEKKQVMDFELAEIDRSVWKILILGLSVLLSSFVFSFLSRDFFFKGNAFKYSLAISPESYAILIAFSAVVFAVSFLLMALLIKSFGTIAWITVVATMGFILPYYDKIIYKLAWYPAASVALLFGILLLAAYSGWEELHLLMKVKFFRVGQRIVPKVMTSLALFLSVVFYLGLLQGEVTIISKDTFKAYILGPTEGIMKSVLPTFSYSKSGQQILEDVMTQQLNATPEAAKLPAKARADVVAKSVAEVEDKVKAFLHVDINFKMSVSDILYEFISKQIVSATGVAGLIVGITVLVFTFTIIKFLGLVLGYVALLIGFIVFEFLLAINFGTVVMETRTREMLIMK